MENNVVLVEESEGLAAQKDDALSLFEINLAKKHKIDVSHVEGEGSDLIKKDGETKGENAGDKDGENAGEKSGEKGVKKEETNGNQSKEKSDDIPVEELDSFEKLHDIYQSKPELFYKLPKKIKQLYHSQKGLYKRMKDEEEKRKKVEDDVGLKKIQDSVSRIKLDRIKNRLANPEGLTIEELQELIDEKKEVQNDEDRPLTVKDLEAMKKKEREEALNESELEKERQSNVARRVQEAESIAKANISDITGGKYDNFDDVIDLAQEMIKSKSRYGAQVAGVINSDADVQEIVDVLVDIAKLNPRWGTLDKSSKKPDNVSADKIVKNAAKQVTSASLAGGRGSREIHISEDMDIEEAYRVWDKIPRDIRHKILKRV